MQSINAINMWPVIIRWKEYLLVFYDRWYTWLDIQSKNILNVSFSLLMEFWRRRKENFFCYYVSTKKKWISYDVPMFLLLWKTTGHFHMIIHPKNNTSIIHRL